MFNENSPKIISEDTEEIFGKACYNYGDRESKIEAKEYAKKLALKDAIQKSGVYINATSKSKNFMLSDDIIELISSKYMKFVATYNDKKDNKICCLIDANINPIDISSLKISSSDSPSVFTDDESHINHQTTNENSKNITTGSIKEQKSSGWQDITMLTGMNSWTQKIGSGKIIADRELGLVKISSQGYGETYLENKFYDATPGIYRLVAQMKFHNVKKYGNKNYERGKFQAIVMQGNNEKYHPDNDFLGSQDWHTREVTVSIRKNQYPYFRIGFQEATGVIYIRDIKIYKE